MRGRLLPNGRVDLLRQISLFGGAYLLYRLVEGAVGGQDAAAFVHARQMISVERSLHVFVEPSLQSWAAGSHLLLVIATYIYISAQTLVLFGVLLYLYVAHNRSYYFVRNMLIVAMGIALLGYAFYPTAPPRLLPEWGFIDTNTLIAGVNSRGVVNEFVNQYAAIPSMHVAFATILALPLARLVRSRLARVLWSAWPVVITFVTVITGNHFLIDAALGLLTAATSAAVAWRLAALRPHVWAFYPRPSSVPAT